jgi:uncharacterized membrane protein YdbT with pleckstrin-like domain
MSAMGYPPELLADGEEIEFEMRPHWRALLFPSLIIGVTALVLVWLFAFSSNWFDPGSNGQTIRNWVFIGGAAVVIGLFAARPLLYWISTQYVFTDRRIIVRSGLVSKTGRDLPLSKVQNVSFRIPAMGRMLNYGSLMIDSAGDESVLINDVTDVEHIQREVTRLADADQQRRFRDMRGLDG